jgi:hypothetical protein
MCFKKSAWVGLNKIDITTWSLVLLEKLIVEDSGQKFLDPEDKGTKNLQNVGNCLPIKTAWHFRRFECSAKPLREPQRSHVGSCFAVMHDVRARWLIILHCDILGIILLGLPAKILYAFLLRACLMPYLSYPLWKLTKITKFLIMQFSQPHIIQFKAFTATKFSSLFQG